MINNSVNFENIIPSLLHVVDRYCDSVWFVPPDKRDFHNFMLVVSGEGTSITDGTRYDMRPGMLFYHHSCQSFGFESSDINPMHCFGVNFRTAEVCHALTEPSVQNVGKLPFENFMKVSDMDILVKYFSHLVDVWEEKRTNYQLKLRSIFLNILFEVSYQLMQHQSNSETVQSIELVKSYIHRNYNRYITLDSLADMAGLNPSYLGSIFKKSTGSTPVEYINSIRVEKAAELLGIGYSAAKAASLSGFNDPFYFSKVFKKYKGISPRKYRETPLNFC